MTTKTIKNTIKMFVLSATLMFSAFAVTTQEYDKLQYENALKVIDLIHTWNYEDLIVNTHSRNIYSKMSKHTEFIFSTKDITNFTLYKNCVENLYMLVTNGNFDNADDKDRAIYNLNCVFNILIQKVEKDIKECKTRLKWQKKHKKGASGYYVGNTIEGLSERIRLDKDTINYIKKFQKKVIR